MSETTTYTKKDFVSDQEVRWCPGCGDYSILSAVQTAMTQIGKKREDICFVSGIGCSSRFPYYMNTFGMHTIHGRAAAIASGLKIQNPNLSVWVATGDGDAMAIGGNHLIHALRRNVDINIIMFNNEIYGLTKGQYSPTTKRGVITKTTPYGVVDHPFVPASLALGCDATFFARAIDTDVKHLTSLVVEAANHKGTTFIEIFQNCVIFSDGIHEAYAGKATRDDNTIKVEHGKPMIFGKERNKGIILRGTRPEVVTIGENGITEKDLLVHDKTDDNMAYMLSRMKFPELPVALGIFRQVSAPSYEMDVEAQIAQVTSKKGAGNMKSLLHSGQTWNVG
ncbi:MAG: 2-oxoacid:ferredoxin oxidoreductase subunit beta [Bdellovibrionales bacterium RIFOXYD12_FULL_39_22]|nr:MAG: 2-oxoacid:ferredoxin oxidoreductase subunit beta [Bdellovibrionales bacterium RIFOXYB1_FULL_39_21]OFZ40488.1 MAG: 2-oxoacid:ferredoxin oxidoreductase subunit beta [Bdellovibrionales bacterium RIFOXYC12_FULL_39_17]OFZ49971.1 MAG: 2-oxoacid:ferredoxin oxidoreductase subunit beta [Bdellovibrionales bacterium RIFOXYC1_FULL_39_130]OFZ77613.1 MAG: 2-oxoacid:ferredoxin oxidoreductase subunit beta [Bdellovibrionales bacterium RIFOXYD1_FULL_39_84]OFZ96067.1 MAG: 2-oxoacid:ferredoxin oxidoreducta